jgi:hypothetical protein
MNFPLSRSTRRERKSRRMRTFPMADTPTTESAHTTMPAARRSGHPFQARLNATTEPQAND